MISLDVDPSAWSPAGGAVVDLSGDLLTPADGPERRPIPASALVTQARSSTGRATGAATPLRCGSTTQDPDPGDPTVAHVGRPNLEDPQTSSRRVDGSGFPVLTYEVRGVSGKLLGRAVETMFKVSLSLFLYEAEFLLFVHLLAESFSPGWTIKHISFSWVSTYPPTSASSPP